MEIERHTRSHFKIVEQGADAEGPRLGQLSLPGRRPLETPNFISLTSRGTVPHITPDLILKYTQFSGVHLALEDFLWQKNRLVSPPSTTDPTENTNISPLHTFTALPSQCLTLMTPRRTPAIAIPTGNSDTAIGIYTSTGFQEMSNEFYLDAMQKLRPDICVGIADLAYNAEPGRKRLAKMNDRTTFWLKESREFLRDVQQENDESKTAEPCLFAPVLPISHHAQSEYLNTLAESTDDDQDESAPLEFHGLAFYDTDILPSFPPFYRSPALNTKPRLSLDEPKNPQEVLRQISLGVDIFTIPFANAATDAGLALVFEFPRPSLPAVSEEMKDRQKRLSLAMDLLCPSCSYATSIAPLLHGCECYTCVTHQRAYITHLLHAREMLAWTLLQIHNNHVMFKFFEKARESLRGNKWEDDIKVFESSWESDILGLENSATVEGRQGREGKGGKNRGPRLRGYQFKTEGPGEKKKNVKAWDGFDTSEKGGVKDEGKDEQGGKKVPGGNEVGVVQGENLEDVVDEMAKAMLDKGVFRGEER